MKTAYVRGLAGLLLCGYTTYSDMVLAHYDSITLSSPDFINAASTNIDLGQTYTTGQHFISFAFTSSNASNNYPWFYTGARGQFEVTGYRTEVEAYANESGSMFADIGLSGMNLLGSIAQNTQYSLTMLIDLDADTANISVSGIGEVTDLALPTDAGISNYRFDTRWNLNVTDFTWSIVPEPSSVALCVAGALAVCGARTMKRKAQPERGPYG